MGWFLIATKNRKGPAQRRGRPFRFFESYQVILSKNRAASLAIELGRLVVISREVGKSARHADGQLAANGMCERSQGRSGPYKSASSTQVTPSPPLELSPERHWRT